MSGPFESNIADPVKRDGAASFNDLDTSSFLSGYSHAGYAASLAQFGLPMKLPACRGWLLSRPVGTTGEQDAMGCYPLFCCTNWRQLPQDIEALREKFLTVFLVADPFGDHDENFLKGCFDRVIPFKKHFVVDLARPMEGFTSARHRKFARRAQRQMSISVSTSPLSHLDQWIELYGKLARRHGIRGIRAFSREAFQQQLALPGLVMFCASRAGEIIGMDLWYVQGDVAQGHLSATSELGYELHAAYGLKMAVMEYFKDKVRWVNLGGAAGLDAAANDGLADFKRGWASGVRTVWFCGKILQPEKYATLLGHRNLVSSSYFPAYREGEFS